MVLFNGQKSEGSPAPALAADLQLLEDQGLLIRLPIDEHGVVVQEAFEKLRLFPEVQKLVVAQRFQLLFEGKTVGK